MLRCPQWEDCCDVLVWANDNNCAIATDATGLKDVLGIQCGPNVFEVLQLVWSNSWEEDLWRIEQVEGVVMLLVDGLDIGDCVAVAGLWGEAVEW